MADGVKELRQECRVHYSQLEKKSHQKGEGQEKFDPHHRQICNNYLAFSCPTDRCRPTPIDFSAAWPVARLITNRPSSTHTHLILAEITFWI